MSKLELIEAMYNYNEWANGCILDAVDGLDAPGLADAKTASHESIQELLVHTLGAQVFWLTRWRKGDPWPTKPLVAGGRMMASLREGFAATDAGIREFIGSLSEDGLDRPTAMPEWIERMKGVELPLWQVMMQIIGHGIHHRAEAQSSLTAAGHPVQDLDYILWEIDRKRT